MPSTWRKGEEIQRRWLVHVVFPGGMGIVYVVYDRDHGAVYAMKTFRDDVLARDPEIRERFRREALAWTMLGVHPHIVRAGWFQEIEHRPCLFLEYVSGGNLGRWMGTGRLMADQLRVLRLAFQFCDGMIHAASKGITAHRDIKPANCMIAGHDAIKITDFGLARILDHSSLDPVSELVRQPSTAAPEAMLTPGPSGNVAASSGHEAPHDGRRMQFVLTVTGQGAGTPSYMAPEQFHDVKRADVRSDIYSFGVMLFEMLTGRLPFYGATWQELISQHEKAPVPALPKERAAFNDLVQTCLAKDPAARLGSFSEVRVALAQAWPKLTAEDLPKPAKAGPVDAVIAYNKGASLVALGRYQEGIHNLDAALTLDSSLWEAWSNEGVALVSLNRAAEALACYDRGLEINPNSVELWANKANALNDLGRHEEAIECADHALAIDAYCAGAWINKGQALRRRGQFEDALSCFHHAVAADPRAYEAWFDKGDVLRVMGRSPMTVLECFEHCLELDPHRFEAWLGKAQALAGMGRHQEALACLDCALSLGAPLLEVETWKGITLLASEHADAAIACFDQVLRAQPGRALAWMGKGLALMTLRQPEQAAACFGEANRLGMPLARRFMDGGPVSADALMEAILGPGREASRESATALAAAGAGHPEEAVHHFDRALRSQPRNAALLFNKARALLELQQHREALACLDKALELDQNDPEIWINRGSALGGLGRYTEELACYDRALQLNPHYLEAWFNRSIVLVTMRRFQEAVECLDRLLQIDPGDAMAWYNKGALLAGELGKYREALTCFEHAQRLGHPQAADAILWCKTMR